MTPSLHLYIHTPVPVFKARLNMPAATYPIAELVYDGITLGAFADVEFDMMLTLGTAEGLDDLGRVRVKTTPDGDSIPISRASKGTEDGTLIATDNAYITVWEWFTPWAKIPWFDLGDEDDDEDNIDFKDGDIPVGTFNTDIPPVANTGPYFADYIDEVTGVITVEFPKGGVGLSYAVAEGATITDYAWDVKDGTITIGSATSTVITATFPAGFRYIALTVTDSNGVTHSSRCAVLAVDPADDPTIAKYNVSQRLTITGQTLDIELFQDAPRATYPDGTLVLFWWDGASSPDSREHMKFVGWLDKENYSMGRQKRGYLRNTTLHAIDVAGRLAILPGFPQALERVFTEGQWAYMPELDMYKALWYNVFWHSTAPNLADFLMPDLEAYDSTRIDFSGATLLDQMVSQTNKLVPDHLFTVNSQGQMSVVVNWMLQDIGDRPSITPTITASQWNDMQIEYNRHPKVHVLRSAAILAHETMIELDGEDTVPVVLCVAPGDSEAFGQGTQEVVEGEGLALSQEDLNICEGHRYAMLNARFGTFRFSDPTGSNFWNYEPAALKRVGLEIGATLAAQRGLNFTSAAGQVQDMAVEYQVTKRGVAIKANISWVKETDGYPAVTVIPEETEEIGFEPVPPEPFEPPPPNDPEFFYGDMKAYLAWDGATIVRTWDIQEASPVWEEIGASISGTIYDVQYMHITEDQVGAWCMTSSAIYRCEDILAVTPIWVSVLTIVAVRATAVAPTSGLVIFGSMEHYWLDPDHLCIAMSLDTENDDYLHSYYWVTFDGGATWTPVDHTASTFGTGVTERCYYFAGRYSLAAFRSANTLWCARGNGRTGTNTGDGAVFKSTDGGLTWTKGYIFTGGRMANVPSILNPFPSLTDRSYATTFIGGTTPTGAIYVSTDGWVTATLLVEPASHDGAFGVGNHLQRPNKNPDEALHVINLFKIDASSAADLYESDDGGATWSLLENLNNSVITPNGWPPDPLQWALIDDDEAPHVQLTLDNFTTLLDKTGNLASIITWTNGLFPGGFALPRVGANANPLPGWGSFVGGGSYSYLGRKVAV